MSSFFWLPGLVILLAVLTDLLIGDPPTILHPVGWLGRFINACRRCRFSGAAGSFLGGLLVVVSGLIITGGSAWLLQRGLRMMLVSGGLLRQVAALAAASLILSAAMAFRTLIAAGGRVAAALENDDVELARRELARHLVSRPVTDLDRHGIASAAVESLSENFIDSVTAPLFWFVVAGLPGAWCYRFADTADSMLGYRDSEREWFGKAAARLDDILCWIPARITGWLMVVAAALSGFDWRGANRIMRQDARNCASPNSGWAMAVTAGALGIRLEKSGNYVLNESGGAPEARDIRRTVRFLRVSLLVWVPVAALASMWIIPAVGMVSVQEKGL